MSMSHLSLSRLIPCAALKSCKSFFGFGQYAAVGLNFAPSDIFGADTRPDTNLSERYGSHSGLDTVCLSDPVTADRAPTVSLCNRMAFQITAEKERSIRECVCSIRQLTCTARRILKWMIRRKIDDIQFGLSLFSSALQCFSF